MENEKNKISWMRAFRLNLRGYKIIAKMEPAFLPLQTLDSAIIALAPLVNLYMSALIINALAAGISELSEIFLYVGLAVAFNFAFAATQSLTQKKLTVIMNQAWRKNGIFMAEQFMELDFEQIEKSEVNAALADINAKSMATGAGLVALLFNYGPLVQASVGIVAALALLSGAILVGAPAAANFLTTGWATAILATLFVFLPFVSVYRQKYIRRANDIINAIGPDVNNAFGYYGEYIKDAAKDIRIFTQQSVINEIAVKRSSTHIWQKFFHLISREEGITTLANDLLACAAYLLIGLRALWGMYAIGSAVAYIGAARGLSSGISGFVNSVIRLKTNADFLPQVFEYLDLPKTKRLGTMHLKDCEHVVEFHDVSFKYPGAEKYALRNLSFKFHMGQKLAIVGQNGSGKTTTIKLLCRLYEPTEGRITLDGIDACEYDYDEYLSLFSAVFQDFATFGFTLGQNVACAEKYDETRAKKALADAGFEYPPSITQDLETPLLKDLSKEGVNLSGGESQKVAIARALYKDAPFILLDEPTAALDPESEFDVYFRINKISAAKSVVYISHRLASCRFCNDIIVFDEGRLVQNGSHEELLAREGGKYRELWNAQAQYYGESASG